ncbi:T9SS type A sorting domain-containing protein [Hymenobacter sp. BT189]|uniref:T9SS type A sorting domain-containing protein n=1 Tax=Hymenobacter armeniacus TaxID=2771358 RepID=A0ABR8JUH4_9BACT|nr:T9SS type A sorting domain-containing protein [Hymenobacter armeniacus]
MALGDVTGDGRLDIVVSSNYTVSGTLSGVSVLPGLASGGFGPNTLFSTGANSQSLALGDMNGDGRLDIVMTNSGADAVSVLLGVAGGFGIKTDYPTESSPSSVALGDMNNDGRLDIVTASFRAFNGGTTGAASVLLGLATGGFGPKTTAMTSAIASVALGDLNNDGRLDIVGGSGVNDAITLVQATAAGGWQSQNYAANYYPRSITLGDVNNDGRLDIVTANSDFASSSVLLGQSGGGFSRKTDYPVGANPNCVVLGDVNGDGRLDMVTGSASSSQVAVLLSLASGGFGPKTNFTTDANPYKIALGDVNGDGRLDIVTTNPSANTVSVLLNTGTFTPLATARPVAADVSLFPNPARGVFTVQLPAGFGSTQAELLNALGQVVRRPAVAVPSFRVETAGLAPGVYTLRLHTDAGAVAKRVVVE